MMKSAHTPLTHPYSSGQLFAVVVVQPIPVDEHVMKLFMAEEPEKHEFSLD
jgi:hypothetical protein